MRGYHVKNVLNNNLYYAHCQKEMLLPKGREGNGIVLDNVKNIVFNRLSQVKLSIFDFIHLKLPQSMTIHGYSKFPIDIPEKWLEDSFSNL
jgi:hypothetical protein